MAIWCICSCHAHRRANYESAVQNGYAVDEHEARVTAAELAARPGTFLLEWVKLDDVVEAAVATGCECVNYHVTVFRKAFPPYKPPSQWKPPAPQADGDGQE